MTGYEIVVKLPDGTPERVGLMLGGKMYRDGERVTTDAITARRMILRKRAVVAPGAAEPPPLPEPHSAAWRQ